MSDFDAFDPDSLPQWRETEWEPVDWSEYDVPVWGVLEDGDPFTDIHFDVDADQVIPIADEVTWDPTALVVPELDDDYDPRDDPLYDDFYEGEGEPGFVDFIGVSGADLADYNPSDIRGPFESLDDVETFFREIPALAGYGSIVASAGSFYVVVQS